MVDRYYSQYNNNTSHYSTTNNPSFSSTLLDAVYRSIDRGEDTMRTTMKQNNNYASSEEMANFQRACMIEKWMEKKGTDQKVVTRAKSVTDLVTKKPRKDRENSSTSSSDSSAGGFFSEAEYTFPIQRPKPVRTSGSEFVREKTKINNKNRNGFDSVNRQSENKQSGLSKTKSRALKIYGDLKKVKQPISPGGKLAGFLNTLFTGGGNVKKPKSSSGESPSLKSANASTCSSASSFSRSCLSKTPSCGAKYANGAKRSVRFYIVDDDCQKPLSKSNHNNNAMKQSVVNDELMAHVMEKNRRVEEAARDLLRNYQKKFVDEDEDEDDEEEEDDAASYASSDLFELDNLSAIGMDHQRYREELPVYETTHLENNRAIANRFML